MSQNCLVFKKIFQMKFVRFQRESTIEFQLFDIHYPYENEENNFKKWIIQKCNLLTKIKYIDAEHTKYICTYVYLIDINLIFKINKIIIDGSRRIIDINVLINRIPNYYRNFIGITIGILL